MSSCPTTTTLCCYRTLFVPSASVSFSISPTNHRQGWPVLLIVSSSYSIDFLLFKGRLEQSQKSIVCFSFSIKCSRIILRDGFRNQNAIMMCSQLFLTTMCVCPMQVCRLEANLMIALSRRHTANSLQVNLLVPVSDTATISSTVSSGVVLCLFTKGCEHGSKSWAATNHDSLCYL